MKWENPHKGHQLNNINHSCTGFRLCKCLSTPKPNKDVTVSCCITSPVLENLKINAMCVIEQ